MKSCFLDSCEPVLARISEYPGDEDAWKLLFLLPRMLLSPPARGGKTKNKCIIGAYDDFKNFRWDQLIDRKTSQMMSSEGRKRSNQEVSTPFDQMW